MEGEGSVQRVPSFASTPPRCVAGPAAGSGPALSLFGASSSGEPLAAQLLVVDFTPGPADSAYVTQKCSAFWAYIRTRSDLRSLEVTPDRANMVKELSAVLEAGARAGTAPPAPPAPSAASAPPAASASPTAVSMLEFLEGKGLINRVFEAPLQQSHCSLGPREYREADPVARAAHHVACLPTTSFSYPTSQAPRGVLREPALRTRTRSQLAHAHARRHGSLDVKELCSTLRDWDAKHPKLDEIITS